MNIRLRQTLVVLLLSAFPLRPAFAGGRKSISIVPVNASTIVILLGGKEREYYLLRKSVPLRIQLDGPGKLTVQSRLRITAGRAGVETYAIRVSEGINTLKVQSTLTEQSEGTFKNSEDRAGKSRKFSLTIPEGSFTYDVKLDGTTLDVGMKFTFVPSKQKTKLVAIEPLSYEKIVTVNVKENRLAYYVASREHPVQIRIVGPTKVKINMRLNYDVTMKGEQKFSILVSEGKKLVAQRPLQTTKSTGLVYEEWKEVVPGKPNDIYVEIPGGEHTYKILLGESSGSTLSLRFSVPEADLSNEQ